MLRLRPYKKDDASTILSWCTEEKAFYKWTAGVMGNYPITEKEFAFVENIMAFTAFDDDGICGFFTLRNPGPSLDELRMGFVIISPNRRGKGYGKEMINLGFRYAFDVYGAGSVDLAVFDNNPSAKACYKAAGFKEVSKESGADSIFCGEQWSRTVMKKEKS